MAAKAATFWLRLSRIFLDKDDSRPAVYRRRVVQKQSDRANLTKICHKNGEHSPHKNLPILDQRL